jgi:hypothetical protein
MEPRLGSVGALAGPFAFWSCVLHKKGDKLNAARDVTLSDLLYDRKIATLDHVISLAARAADQFADRLYTPHEIEVISFHFTLR